MENELCQNEVSDVSSRMVYSVRKKDSTMLEQNKKNRKNVIVFKEVVISRVLVIVSVG